MSDITTLPACRRCRSRKIRCNRSIPRCAGCERTAQRCEFVDDASGEVLTREEIAHLEQKEVELQEQLRQNGSRSDGGLGEEPSDKIPIHRTQSASKGVFVGDASGSSFLATMLSNPRWNHVKNSLLDQLRERTAVRSPNSQPASLPTALEARYYVQTYLTGSHLHHPFLMESDVISLLDSVYSQHDNANPDSQDLYRLYMICAIAAVSLKRERIATESPYNFFISARALLGQIPLLGTKDSILNLLLFARFGIYHHIGSSIWEIVRICMRTCIELGFHLPPRQSLPPLVEQDQRRIFWECYIVDRYSSVTLGRPFAIADEDVKVCLPIRLPDNKIALLYPGSLGNSHEIQVAPNSIDVFIFVVRLRQITSRIKKAFFSASEHEQVHLHRDAHSNAGDVYAQLYELLDALKLWRGTGPVFQPAISLYQRAEWYDFLYEKERLWLIRGAMNELSYTGSTPGHLIDMCAEAAIRVIILYKDMFASKVINSTRGYFQMLFTAGLSLIYCRSLGQDTEKHFESDNDATDALDACADVLMNLSDELIDARPYAYVFKHIKDNFFTELFKSRQDRATATSRILNVANQDADPASPDWAQSSTIVADVLPDFPYDPTLPPMPTYDEAFLNHDWLLPAWSPSASRFVAGMEADVNEYAFGDWSLLNMYESGSGVL